MKSIAVYCGSSLGNKPQFAQDAYRIGQGVAQQGIELVYGGGAAGLMGCVADGALSEQGKVTGIITHHLYGWEVGHTGLNSLEVVDSMHQRKARIDELCEAYLLMPGGIGSMDEFFEVFTWRQLGLHAKPIFILNTDNYYQPLKDLLASSVEHQFMRARSLEGLHWYDNPEQVLEAINAHQSQATAIGASAPSA